MRSLVFFLSLLILVQGKALKDDTLDQYLKDILELLKSQMPYGIPDLGIPVLDPLEVPHFDIPHIDETIIVADIAIDNFVIKNLATFETKIAHVDLEELGLDLKLNIANLRGDADYVLDGKVLGIIPLYGDGPMWVEIHDLDLTGRAAVLINAEGFLEVAELTLDAEFSSIHVNFTNLLGDGNLGESLQNIINLMGGFIWDQLKDFLLPLIDDLLIKVLDDAFEGCSIQELIENGSCFKDRLEEAFKNGRATIPLYKNTNTGGRYI